MMPRPENPADAGGPAECGRLPVGDGHIIAWSTSGPEDGIPIVLLHGGPGSGASDDMHRDLQAPALRDHRLRGIAFDQRGCGGSTPRGDIAANTTRHLVADMELLRERLGVDSWIVAGGSWGTTLALRYAVAYPQRCRAVLLRAVTVWSDDKFVWALEGRRDIAPGPWNALARLAGRSDWRGILDSFYGRVFGPDSAQAQEAARTWVAYERTYETAEPADFAQVLRETEPEAAMTKARIGLHYWKHRAFLPTAADPHGLFGGVSRLGAVPVAVVHGSRDHVCHPHFLGAWRAALPQARIEMVPGAGHSRKDPALSKAFQNTLAGTLTALGH